jgi:phosphoglycolate phosphatase
LEEEFNVVDPQPVPVHGCTDQGIVRELFHANGLSFSDDHWSRFMETYLEYLKHRLGQTPGRILPGVHELLGPLQAHEGVYLGLLTGNVQRGAEVKLNHFGLSHYFQGGGFGDHHPLRDDVARAARQNVETELGKALDPDKLWIVGDTPADIQCGRAIGAQVLAVCTGGSTREELAQAAPDLLVDDLTECEDWLLDLLGDA